MIEPHEIHLSPKVAEVLRSAVNLAQKHQVMTVACRSSHSNADPFALESPPGKQKAAHQKMVKRLYTGFN